MKTVGYILLSLSVVLIVLIARSLIFGDPTSPIGLLVDVSVAGFLLVGGAALSGAGTIVDELRKQRAE